MAPFSAKQGVTSLTSVRLVLYHCLTPQPSLMEDINLWVWGGGTKDFNFRGGSANVPAANKATTKS